MRVVKVESGGHPPANGVQLKLLSIDDVPASNGFNPGLKFVFEAMSGPAKGAKAPRTIGDRITPTTAGGKFLAGAYGHAELPVDQEIDLDKLIGRTFIGDVCQSPQGKGTRVERISPMPSKAPAKAAPAKAPPAPEPGEWEADDDAGRGTVPF
jgi:hypothetical protein